MTTPTPANTLGNATPREMPYLVHVDEDTLMKPLDVDACEADWHVSLYGGCCDSCCSWMVPWCCPCVGIGSAAYWAWGEGTAALSLTYFALLIVGSSVASMLDSRYGEEVHMTETLVKDGWYYYYDYAYTVTTTNAYLIATLVLVGVYLLSLGVFRLLFRRKLTLSGDCGTDLLSSLFCSCCVVAQMRTHALREKQRAKDAGTLPAYYAEAH